MSRRRFLRGVLAGGAMVSVPLPRLANAMNSNGDGFVDGSALPKRFGMWFFGNGAGQGLQIATVAVFAVCVIAGVLFWRDLPDFKISMQAFMQAQKHWKCRDCNHEWQN